MSTFAIDCPRQNIATTGVVGTVMEWIDTPEGRRQSETQARDENTGMPLWTVEIIYRSESFGREYTVTAAVTVGALERPEPAAFSPISFEGLTVTVRVNKAGAMVERWQAEGIKADGTKPTTSAELVDGFVERVRWRLEGGSVMTAVSVCVVLALVMLLLMRGNGLGPGSALVAIVFGLTLAATPAGPALQDVLGATGDWLWANGRAL